MASTSTSKAEEFFPSGFNYSSCLTCDDPCTQVDSSILSSIDQKDTLANSIKPYKRHFLVGLSPLGSIEENVKGAPEWPSQVEHIEGTLIPDLKTLAKSMDGKSIITGVQGLIQGQVYQFPDHLKYSLDESQGSTESLLQKIIQGQGESLTGRAYIFVCVHQNRDARCGALGPLILESFRKEIEALGLKDQVFAHGVSHVGGHKYAGNVIVYHQEPNLSGHWYGRVKPSHCRQILQDHILDGKIIKPLWRGSIH
jgi:(2Fe-2S) ferredoxin